MSKKRKKDEDEWVRGAVCVVAEILRTHGYETVAKDCLHVAGRIEDILKYRTNTISKPCVPQTSFPLTNKATRGLKLNEHGSQMESLSPSCAPPCSISSFRVGIAHIGGLLPIKINTRPSLGLLSIQSPASSPIWWNGCILGVSRRNPNPAASRPFRTISVASLSGSGVGIHIPHKTPEYELPVVLTSHPAALNT